MRYRLKLTDPLLSHKEPIIEAETVTIGHGGWLLLHDKEHILLHGFAPGQCLTVERICENDRPCTEKDRLVLRW